MKRFHVHWPSPAMGVALLALFVAMGGAGYAAFRLPLNSVGTAQIKAGAITSNKVANGSLVAHDFKAGKLPVGPRGLRGPAGAAGTAGTAGVAGPPGKDAPPVDFSGETTTLVAPAIRHQQPNGVEVFCPDEGHFCTGVNSRWRNYDNGFQPVGVWRDRGGIVHLEGAAEQIAEGGNPGNPPGILLLPPAYRPPSTRRFPAILVQPNGDRVAASVDVGSDGMVGSKPGGLGVVALEGISWRP